MRHKFKKDLFSYYSKKRVNGVMGENRIMRIGNRYIYQGPIVQSVVSLTSSLRVISLTVLADPIHTILILFAEKM